MKQGTRIPAQVKAIEFLICTLVFLLPVFYLPGFVFAYSASKFVLLGSISIILAGLSAWTFYLYPGLLRRLFRNRLFIFGLCLYVLAYFLAVIHSANRGFSFWSSFERGTGGVTLIFILFFVVAAYLGARLCGVRFVRRAMLASFLGAIILAVTITLSPDGFGLLHWGVLLQGDSGSFMGNSSLAGAYVLFNIFFGLVLIKNYTARNKRIFLGLGVIALAASPLFINFHFHPGQGLGPDSIVGSARGAAMGILLGLALAFAVYLTFSSKKKIKTAGVILLSLSAALVLFLFIRFLDSSSRLHMEFIRLATDTRFRFWSIVLQAFHQHPVLGWGPENFDIPFHLYFDPHIIVSEGRLEIILDRPHNIIMEQIAGGGLVLLLGFLAYLGSIALGLLRSAKRSLLGRFEAAVLLGALLGWFIQDQFVFDSAVSLVMLGLIAGIALAFSDAVGQEEMAPRRNNSEHFAAGTLIILPVLAMLVYFSILPAAKAVRMKNLFNVPPAVRAREWPKLGGLVPMGNDSDTAFFGYSLYEEYRTNLPKLITASADVKANDAEDIAGAIGYFKKITASGGPAAGNYRLTLLVPKFYVMKLLISDSLTPDEVADAKDYVDRALALSPTDPEAYWTLSQLETLENDIPSAKAALAKAAELEPGIAATYDSMLNLATFAKDKHYYDSSLRAAQAAIPGFTAPGR